MTDPRIQARRVRVERQRGHRRLSIVLGAIVAAGAAAGAVAIAHSSLFSARTVVIAGAVQTPRSEILGVTGLNREPPLIDVNTGAMQRRLERLPWVASASVHVDWPSTVAIAVVERIPVAATALRRGSTHSSTRPAGSSRISHRGLRHFPSLPCREFLARRAARS